MVIWYLLHFLLSQLICQLSSSIGKNTSRRSLYTKSDIHDLMGDLKFVHVCRYNKVGSSSTSQTRDKAESELVPGLRAMLGISSSCGQRWYLPPQNPDRATWSETLLPWRHPQVGFILIQVIVMYMTFCQNIPRSEHDYNKCCYIITKWPSSDPKNAVPSACSAGRLPGQRRPDARPVAGQVEVVQGDDDHLRDAGKYQLETSEGFTAFMSEIGVNWFTRQASLWFLGLHYLQANFCQSRLLVPSIQLPQTRTWEGTGWGSTPHPRSSPPPSSSSSECLSMRLLVMELKWGLQQLWVETLWLRTRYTLLREPFVISPSLNCLINHLQRAVKSSGVSRIETRNFKNNGQIMELVHTIPGKANIRSVRVYKKL